MDVDTLVVGAGVVGLAAARALAAAGREVVVLEQAHAIGTATSSRNSGVIHAGIYYPPKSLKASLCVRGKALLYEYCAARNVRQRRCGKLLVATSEPERALLEGYAARALQNGAGELPWIPAREVAIMEPQIRCVAALHSASSGIVVESGGGHVVLNAKLERAEIAAGGFALSLSDGHGTRLRCRELVNAAGLEAPALAQRIAGLSPSLIPTASFARGHYYSLRGPAPIERLIYPVADAHSLGIHATLDLSGRVRFGPDVEWIDAVDYRFAADLRERFAGAIRRYYPALDASRLEPDYTGIRPKINSPDEPAADFRIDGPAIHGVAGLVNLFGIESPGLTASLAIAERVTACLRT